MTLTKKVLTIRTVLYFTLNYDALTTKLDKCNLLATLNLKLIVILFPLYINSS